MPKCYHDRDDPAKGRYMDGNLRRLRERKAFTRAALGKLAGVDASTIHRIELGSQKPYLTTIRKLAVALGVEPGDFTAEQGTYVH